MGAALAVATALVIDSNLTDDQNVSPQSVDNNVVQQSDEKAIETPQFDIEAIDNAVQSWAQNYPNQVGVEK